MAEGQVKVEIVTASANTNLQQLRETISKAKEKLSELKIGTDDYRKQLIELDKAQMLLRNAINGTTATEEDYTKALQGTSKTYNTLVKQLADLKKQMRNIDVSTKQGQDDFDKLSAKIKAVNQELKDMDEKQGSFVRNVGNYTSGLKNLGDILKAYIPSLGGIAKGADDVNKAVQLMGKQPLLGIIGLLAPLLANIAAELKENDGAMKSINKVMDSMKPVMDFFSGILQDIVDVISDLIGKASEFFSGSNIFQKIIQGVMGVGNAILQFIIAPYKAVAAAIKVLKDQGVKGIADAARAMNDEFNKGVAFKTNFQSGQQVADTIIAGASSRKKKAKDAGKDIGKEIGKGVEEGLVKELDSILNRIDEAWDKKLDDRQKRHEQRQKQIADYNKQAAADFLKEQEEEADALADAWLESYHKQEEAAKEAAEKRKAVMEGYVSGTVDLMNTLADALESEDEASEASVKAAKNLRIAAATIDMISGAVTAFSTAQSLGPIAGPIVGAINAAAVVASGLANIAKIRSTSVSKDSTPSASTAATVSAPSMPTVSPTTVTTGASTETALNQAAQPQKVYILQSEIEAAGQTSQVQVAESSF